MTTFWIIAAYLACLILLGLASSLRLKKSQEDYFAASRGIGAFMLFMSLFGTTMTAFAMVGSSGEASQSGIGVYGLMASWSGIVHSLCFFLVGAKLWSYGKRYGYLTQIQFFRDRFESNNLGLVLFPIIAGMMIPYLLVGIIGLGKVIPNATIGAFPEVFKATQGGIPDSIGMGVICAVVLLYVFIGGVRGTVWINAFQNVLFLVVGVVTLLVISEKLGGVADVTRMVEERNPHLLRRGLVPGDETLYQQKLARYERDLAAFKAAQAAATASAPVGSAPAGGGGRPAAGPTVAARPPAKPEPPRGIEQLYFLSYGFIPLSVAMFPHLFTYYLTAKSAKSFRLSVVMHPIFILVLWLPCVLIGVWATSAVIDGKPVVPPGFPPNAILARFVRTLGGEWLGGLMAASILATNSLDAQFLTLGAMFTNDIVAHHAGRKRFTDAQLVLIGRLFVVGVVIVSYLLAVYLFSNTSVFGLGTWCFAGYASLAPLLLAAIYWKRVTKAGAYASILASGATWWWLFAASGFGAEEHYTVLGLHPVAPVTLAATAALVLVSLATRPPSPATVARFVR